MRGKASKIYRYLRYGILLFSAVAAALIFRNYQFERLPDTIGDLGNEVPAGGFMILTEADADTVLGVGSLVEAEYQGQVFYSRIAGVPGETVSLDPLSGGKVEVRVAGRKTYGVMPRSGPLKEGVIPEGHFVLIDPAPEMGGADSRYLGLVPRSWLRRKILAGFRY